MTLHKILASFGKTFHGNQLVVAGYPKRLRSWMQRIAIRPKLFATTLVAEGPGRPCIKDDMI